MEEFQADHSSSLALEGIKPAMQDRSKDKFERMLKVGNKLLESDGYDGLHISKIAERAECSVGAFYERFRDKETFFRLLLERSRSHIEQGILPFFTEEHWAGHATHDIVAGAIAAMLSWFRRHKGLYCAALIQNLTPFRVESKALVSQLVALLKTREHEFDHPYPDLESAVWFAMQMTQGTLIHAAFSSIAQAKVGGARPADDRNLALHDPELESRLTYVFCRCVGIRHDAPPTKPNPPGAD